jgi:catechol 2,3-dioxygenase-like lactoylglutathione lyase family enzyme
MTILRMDHVGVIVDDLEAALAFFIELGMELDGEAAVQGPWVDRVCGLDDVRVDIAMGGPRTATAGSSWRSSTRRRRSAQLTRSEQTFGGQSALGARPRILCFLFFVLPAG